MGFKFNPLTGQLNVTGNGGGGGGSGTVTSVSVATANGVSGTVANPTTTPELTLALGAITPTSVNSVVVSGSATPTLAVSGTSSISGTNTGDQTTITGNAGTATALQTGRTISISGDLTYTSPSFNGTSNVTAAGTLATVNASTGSFGSATSVATFTVNGKGLITAASSTSIQITESQVTNLTSDLAGKQATLVSGTNIKTINGNSILGSGDLTISGSGAVWGSITGTLSDQTDLQAALDAKVEYTATSPLDMNNNTLTNVNGAITSYPDTGIAIISSQVTTADTAGVGASVVAGQAKGTADGGTATIAGGGADTEGNGGDVLLQVGQGAGAGVRGKIIAYGATFSLTDTGALDFSEVTGNQVYTFPNNTGTIALVDGVYRLPEMKMLI